MSVDRAWVEGVANQLLGHRDAVRLATRTPDGPRWSTTGLLLVGQAALRIAGELRDLPARAVATNVVEVAATGQGCPASSNTWSTPWQSRRDWRSWSGRRAQGRPPPLPPRLACEPTKAAR
jgi:hypothetical protein